MLFVLSAYVSGSARHGTFSRVSHSHATHPTKPRRYKLAVVEGGGLSNPGVLITVGIAQTYSEARRLFERATANSDGLSGAASAPAAYERLRRDIARTCPLLGRRVILDVPDDESLNLRLGTAVDFGHKVSRIVLSPSVPTTYHRHHHPDTVHVRA